MQVNRERNQLEPEIEDQVPHRDKLEDTVREVTDDAAEEPQYYLDHTVIPGGGE